MRLTLIVALLIAAATPAAAQDRPFLFSVATTSAPTPAVRFDYDVGVGDRAFQSDVSNQPEQPVGIHASSRSSYAFKASLSIALVSAR